MTAIREHFAHHPLHMVGCAIGCVAIILAIVLGAPLLAIAGGAMCAVMMIGMAWMMVSMVSHGRH